MGDFNTDTDMISWGKAFVVKIFSLCTAKEVIPVDNNLGNKIY